MSSPNSATRALHRLSTRLAPPPDRLVWNGSALVGAARTRAIEVLVPARLLATRGERFPAAAPEALRAAAALRAQRAFAPLGQVVCEALIGAPGRDGCPVLLLALPQAVIAAIRAAAAADRRTLAAIRPAELAQAVPAGGVVHGPGDACLVAFADGFPAALAPLGDPAAPAFAERLARERLRLGADPAAPARPPAGPALDFLHPLLAARVPLLARPGVRVGALAAAAALALAGGALLWLGDLAGERDQARAALARLAPTEGLLRGYRDEMRTLRPWFEARSDPARDLAVLARALPESQVRLTRVRQAEGGGAVAEGVAGDRALLFELLARLRRDPAVASAELRSFRALSKGGQELTFELVLRLHDGRSAPEKTAGLEPGGPREDREARHASA